MSDFQHIPLEPIQHILSFLPDGQLSFIRPLALTCRSWTAAAQIKLFTHVVISQKGQWLKLLKRLKASAHFRECVRTLEVVWEISLDPRKQRQDPLSSELQLLFPCMESIQYHQNVRDQSLLLALVTARSLSEPKTAASARSTIRNLDIAVHLDSISPLEKLFRFQSQWDKLVLRFYWNYWDYRPFDLGAGASLDIKSLTIMEPSSGAPFHIALLKGTTFCELQKLVIHLTDDNTQPVDGDFLAEIGADSKIMDTLSRVGEVEIELQASNEAIVAQFSAYFAAAYERQVVQLKIMDMAPAGENVGIHEPKI